MSVAERVKRTIENHKFTKEMCYYDATYEELNYFRDLVVAGDHWDGITGAFDYGFIKGMRYQRAQEEKRKAARI